ncbi:MAG: YrhK family protein [Micromonosporaceae bacterium]
MQRSRARAFLADYPWVHLGIGIFGNVTFVVGSFLFLRESLQQAGVWLFIFGSGGMLLGSVGDLLARLEQRVRQKNGKP